MSKVAVVTDTISCLPPDLAKKMNIHVIPANLVIDGKNYRDTDLSNEEFWKLFYGTKDTITTNAINPTDFETLFSTLSKNTDSIVCILVSRQLSATYQSAQSAKQTLQQKIPALNIEVIDSKSATLEPRVSLFWKQPARLRRERTWQR